MKLNDDLVYLVIIQAVCRVLLLLLLLQRLQCVLELCLQVLHLTGGQNLSRTSLSLALCSDLLAVNNLMRKSRNTAQVKTSKIYVIIRLHAQRECSATV